jgi:hypothetical protein
MISYLSLKRKYPTIEANINPVVIAPISGILPKPAVAKKKMIPRRIHTFWMVFVLPWNRLESLMKEYIPIRIVGIKTNQSRLSHMRVFPQSRDAHHSEGVIVMISFIKVSIS